MAGELGVGTDAGTGVRSDEGAGAGPGDVGLAVGEVRLSTVHNFRDVAGPGYPVRPAGSMRRGVVYRSTALTVDDDDLRTLERLNVSAVIDLRTDEEIAKQPDVLPAGARYLSVDVLSGNTTSATLTGSGALTAADARREMALTYDRFVLGEAERAAFGRALEAVALSSGPAIVHCTAGKDRTGWISAVLQLLAGVGEDDVVADYLLTREMSAEFVAAIRAHVRAELPEQAEAIDVLIGVEESNIRRSLDALTREFGDARRYLVEGAGLDDRMVDELGARLIWS